MWYLMRHNQSFTNSDDMSTVMDWGNTSPVEALPWLFSTFGTGVTGRSQHLCHSGDRRETLESKVSSLVEWDHSFSHACLQRWISLETVVSEETGII